jgi:hypothetical protein
VPHMAHEPLMAILTYYIWALRPDVLFWEEVDAGIAVLPGLIFAIVQAQFVISI